MSGLTDFRAQHPEYNAVPDGVLADKLYQKFYSSIPREQFDAKLGISAQPSSIIDAARSVPGGLAKGVAGIAGLPGDIQAGVDWASKKIASVLPGYNNPEVQAMRQASPPQEGGGLPTSGDTISATGNAVGGYYQPKTTAGKYAETISSFAPAALAPGGIAARIARAVVPGVASETAGQVTEGTDAEPYARAAGALLGAGGVAAAPSMASVGARALNRGWSAMGHSEFLNPNDIAAQHLSAAINREGGMPRIGENLADWSQTGASNPALIDVSGNNVRRLVRSAAAGPTGEAQNVAQQYGRGIEANLQDRTADMARGLTPDEQRSAEAVAADLGKTRGNLATEQYREPYAEPAAVTKDMVSALQGPEGRAAIGRAYAAARAKRDLQQMSELSDLRDVAAEQSGGADPLTGKKRTLEDALQNVSAGSLDRVRIAMRGIGDRLARNGASDIASGYRDRVTDIDTALDQTPGLQEARGNYRNLSQQIEAIPTGQAAVNTPAQAYGEQIAAMSPESRGMAGVGYRDSLVAGIERPTAGGTGFLNRIANSNRQTANLGATYGPETADRFQGGIANEIARIHNARFISPNTGSQTALRADEAGLIDAIPTTHAGMLTRAISAIRNGLTLTDAQREAIVRLGTSEANLRQLSARMPSAQPQAIARQLMIAGQLSAGNTRSP